MFDKKPMPEFFNIDYSLMENGDHFSFKKVDLGDNGINIIIEDAKKNGIVLRYLKSEKDVDFWCMDSSLKDKVNKPSKKIYENVLETLSKKSLSRTELRNICGKDNMHIIDSLEKEGKIFSKKIYQNGKGRPTIMFYLLTQF